MKALIILVAAASTAYVGYSYNATDGESCLVCPMTGEAVFASAEAEPETGACCASCADKSAAMLTAVEGEGSAKSACCSEASAAAMLTAVEGEGSACCSAAKAACCSKGGEAVLTSTTGDECHGDCEKGCCKDKEATAEQDVVADAAAGEEEVAAEATGAE